jgi:hypothetical protein
MITLHDLCAHLLPPAAHVQFKTLIIDEPRLILVAAMMAPKAPCPDCHHLASRVHSGYQRTLTDLPWTTAPMQLRLHIRRFLCTTCTCSRQTFSERLPTIAPLYARTTTRLAGRQEEHSVILTAQGEPFYDREKRDRSPIEKESQWAQHRLSRYLRSTQVPSGRDFAASSTLALTSGSIGFKSNCPIHKPLWLMSPRRGGACVKSSLAA